MSLFSGLFSKNKSKDDTKTSTPKTDEAVSQTSNEGLKQELRELSFEKGDDALRPKKGLLDTGKAMLGMLGELHGKKGGSKGSGDKLKEMMSSSHAKRAAQIRKIIETGVSNDNTFHALTAQLMGGDTDKVKSAYTLLSDNGMSLTTDLARLFEGHKQKHEYMVCILEKGEPDLKQRLKLAAGMVTNTWKSQTELMKLVEGADAGELEAIFTGPEGKDFLKVISETAHEWLNIFKGKGKRILAAVKGMEAEKKLDEAISKSGEDSKEASEAWSDVVKAKSEQLCEVYHQRWSNLKGQSRTAVAGDIERICKSWDTKLRKAVVAKGTPFWSLLEKEQASYNVFIRLGKGTATYLLNLVAGEAGSSSDWFPEEKPEEKKETREDDKQSTPLTPRSDTPLGKGKKLELSDEHDTTPKSEGDEGVEMEDAAGDLGITTVESDLDETEGETSVSETKTDTGGEKGLEDEETNKPDTSMIGPGPMGVLRELERKKSSKSGLKHLKGGYFMKWETLEDKVAELDDTQRLELLVSLLSEDERLAMFDPEAEPSDIDAMRELAIARLRDTTLIPAGMSGNVLVRFMGAFRRGASQEGHREDSAYGRLRALATSKMKYLDFGKRALAYVAKLRGSEIFEVVNDSELLATLEKRCGSNTLEWNDISTTLNLASRSESGKTSDESGSEQKADVAKAGDLGISGEEARQNAADLVELRPEFWSTKLRTVAIGGIANTQRHETILILNGALNAAIRRYRLTIAKKGNAPKGLTPKPVRVFTREVCEATAPLVLEDLEKDPVLSKVFQAFRNGQFASASMQLEASYVDQPYQKMDEFLKPGKAKRVMELVKASQGRDLLMQWSNYGDWLALKERLDEAKKKEDGQDKETEVKLLEGQIAEFTLDVNQEVQDTTRFAFSTTQRVKVLEVIRNRLADAMEKDPEFRDADQEGFDMGRFSQERTRTLGALDEQQVEDSTAQWSLLSATSALRKESRDMVIGRVRTGYETLREGKREGKEEEAKKDVETRQSDKIKDTRTELKERTANFAKVRDTANTITMAVVGTVVGALMTAVATGVSVATFGAGGVPIWAAMLFAAGSAVGSSAVTLALEKALKGDKFNATEAVANAALKVVLATASAGAGGFGDMVGASLGLKGMQDIGSLVGMAVLKSTIQSAVKRGLQMPMSVSKLENDQIPGHLLGELAGFMGDIAGSAVTAATGGALLQATGLSRGKDGNGEIIDHLGEKATRLTTLESTGKSGLNTVATIAGKIPPLTVKSGTAAVKKIHSIIKELSDESVRETDSKEKDQTSKSEGLVGWRTSVRILSFAAMNKAAKARELAKDKASTMKDEALDVGYKAEALEVMAGILTELVGNVSDGTRLEELYKELVMAVGQLDDAMKQLEQGQSVKVDKEDEGKELEGSETRSVTEVKQSIDRKSSLVENTSESVTRKVGISN